MPEGEKKRWRSRRWEKEEVVVVVVVVVGREKEEERMKKKRERERDTGRETQKKEEALVGAQVEDLKALGAFFAFGEGGKRLGKDAGQGRRVL